MGSRTEAGDRYLAWLCAMFMMLTKIRAEGLLSVEALVDRPDASVGLHEYPEIVVGPELELFCDILRLMVDGGIDEVEAREYVSDAIAGHAASGTGDLALMRALAWALRLATQGHAAHTAVTAAWHQLPISDRPDFEIVSTRLKTIGDDYDNHRWSKVKRQRDRRIRDFIAGLQGDEQSGSAS